ncbi:50S ribosomal protein L6 [Patescibacteria group bacterium]|nr:50S ribosomal protein L6 [Patescibacteria group bacterium]
MSRIGKQPIQVPQGVEINYTDRTIKVKGPKGELEFKHHPKVKLEITDDQIIVTPQNDNYSNMHGLTRTLINNMVEGVTKGFEKQLEIQGVGYKAQIQGKKVNLALGYSHPVEYTPPESVNVEMDKDKKNIIIVTGIDKQAVGEVAAQIRKFKPPEPYKGKGIRYVGEHVTRKAGKTASKGA